METPKQLQRKYLELCKITEVHRSVNLDIIAGLTTIDTIKSLVEKGVSMNVAEIAEWQDFMINIRNDDQFTS